MVNLARHIGVDAEAALATASAKFERRFRDMEQAVRDKGAALGEMSLDSLELEWQAAKGRIG